MTSAIATQGSFSVRAYQGDAKTLLAFNLGKSDSKNLAGFTIQCQPANGPAYYLLNNLQFEKPGDHAQVASEPSNSSINAPFHKFRWLHVPGSFHQGLQPSFGTYTYTVTPRYFDDAGSLQPLDPGRSASVRIDVQPFEKGSVALGFTRGFVQSQAFVHHFGKNALIRPGDKTLQFDTTAQSGANAEGQKYTFADEYQWLGFTARARIFDILSEVENDASLHVDMFAYDLNEPDIIGILLKLAEAGRILIILDNAALHHGSPPTPEDQFEKLFRQKAQKGADILRGKFGRYAHDKVLIVSKQGRQNSATKVLTGSTNYSVTGLYVNSNHVLVFDDPTVAQTYSNVFQAVWEGNADRTAFESSPFAGKVFSYTAPKQSKTSIAFSPHPADFTTSLLLGIAERIAQEGKKTKNGSVLFAVMQLTPGNSPILQALMKLHADQNVFSFGISDSPGGIELYAPGKKSGVLVSGKPASTVLPPPFDQVPGVGLGHQVHHKFVVCGFNDADAVVYCGSSNLATGGEENNGDNLLAIHDQDVATVFAIEALTPVDHFNFLDRYAKKTKQSPQKKNVAQNMTSNVQAAVSAKWFLSTDGKWTGSYFEPNDLHCSDRTLFA
jgi:phosphatidylserine/phosphatidylglycerophosphate/cardiolipin synthase-like enzyme